ncbi:amylo-alpha-1,6-glucosidase [Negadavirga shengliensis]|uniref:Amylo-alpha-1,6-glucosidase n=1 Tax=Negadavirga shengliensis TaxID=1389218 RepID=A0ABV9T338_9BACT
MNSRILSCAAVGLLLLQGMAHAQKEKPIWNKSLDLQPQDPIYTTYAAAQERSQYLRDQGYEFPYYKEDQALGFYSQKGGDICLMFKQNDLLVKNIGDYYRRPALHTTTPDLVHFSAMPIKGFEVKGTYMVYASGMVIQEVDVENQSDDEMDITLIPYLQNQYRRFDAVNLATDDSYLTFEHQKYPDGWSLAHGIPYVDSLKNLFLLPEGTTSLTAANVWKDELPRPAYQFDMDKAPTMQIFGRAYEKGERLVAGMDSVKMMAWVNGDTSQVITASSPIWGSAIPTVGDEGLFRLELAHLIDSESAAANFEVMYFNEGLKKGQSQPVAFPSEETTKRIDFDDWQDDFLHPPQVEVHRSENGAYTIKWSKVKGANHYRIYKREYPAPVYKWVKSTTKLEFEFNGEVREGQLRGYIVVPVGRHPGMHSQEVLNMPQVPFSKFLQGEHQTIHTDANKYLAGKLDIKLEAGEKKTYRWVRVSDHLGTPDRQLLTAAQQAANVNLQPYIAKHLAQLDRVPSPQFDKNKALLYWSAWNMMKQVFYPPEGASSYNYYVFSREPVWGWGHGGQVFHESITMLAYAYLDPNGAMDSQRVYKERQYENGYINYRTGAYLDEIIEHNDQLTSSAPWYNWLNWEIYQITGDKTFLEEMYASGKKFYEFYVSERDADGDGLLEWGGHAVLESVRDALVAVWDEVGWPSNFESVDLNCMMVMEAKSLEQMAMLLGLEEEAKKWREDHEERARLINEVFWDPETGFYYNANKEDNSFTFKEKDDLKRAEIIGFLPMWAGVADGEQAKALVTKLTDPAAFWRKNGVPSLAANDSYYNSKGYWNGPVWVEWNYLIYRGLKDYGYDDFAWELTERLSGVMVSQLRQNHNLWEFYSPDEDWAGYHKTYIWAGIINRMLIDEYREAKD